MPRDRTVHAQLGIAEVVRYDRAGKWYIEVEGVPPRRVTLEVAVREALRMGDMCGDIWLGLPGGKKFDALLKRLDGSS